MPNALYDLGRQAFASALVDWPADVVRIAFVHTGGGLAPVYSVNLQTDEFLSDIPAGAVLATSPPLANKTNVIGVCGADDNTTLFVPLTSPIGALVLYQDTGLPATSRLLVYLSNAAGLPYVITLSDILVQWARIPVNAIVAPRIFKL